MEGPGLAPPSLTSSQFHTFLSQASPLSLFPLRSVCEGLWEQEEEDTGLPKGPQASAHEAPFLGGRVSPLCPHDPSHPLWTQQRWHSQ